MASGDALFSFVMNQAETPDSNAAPPDKRNVHLVRDFDAAKDGVVLFSSVLPEHYGGNGMDIRMQTMASTATSGNFVPELSVERTLAGTTDLDTDSFATAKKTGGTATNGTSGVVTNTTIAFTNSEIDGLLKNERFRLKFRRLGSSDANDTMAGDLELVSIYATET